MNIDTTSELKNEIIGRARKIVIKIGSSTITRADGTVNIEFMQELCTQIKELHRQGKQVVVVSSGARMAGVSSIDKWSRKEDMTYKQALCAIGQVELMGHYRKVFLKQELHTAQLLLTRHDFENTHCNLNIRNVLFTLIDEGVVPIVNENDTVCVEEMGMGDNDVLSAHVGILWGADLLMLLSDIDGVFDKNPKENQDARLISFIDNTALLEGRIDTNGKSSFGTGGMRTKLEAAKLANKYGCAVMITNGSNPSAIISALSGDTGSSLIYEKMQQA